MDLFFAAAALLLSALSLLLSVSLTRTVRRLRTAPAPEAAPVSSDELRRERELNEGVENILSYSVRLGRDKTTGGDAL